MVHRRSLDPLPPHAHHPGSRRRPRRLSLRSLRQGLLRLLLARPVRLVHRSHQTRIETRPPQSPSGQHPRRRPRPIPANTSLIENLATCKLLEVSADLQCPPYCARGSASSCDIYAHNLTDANAEEQRLTKRRDELTKLRATLQGRLSNESYVAKAPPQLVKQTQDQLAEVEAEL